MSNKISRVTPFIRPINLAGGTFYTFSSASEDLSLSFGENPERKFKFSKFALINIPDIQNEPLANTVKLNAIPGAYNSVNFNRTTDWNNHLAESFQNYCLNLETSIISKDSYNNTNSKTVSERVFFKWLKEISAIRFQEDTPQSALSTRYIEEKETEKYKKVVQYIGNIDFVNNYSGKDNSYSEVYVHVPTEVGNFDKVYFKTTSDDNYYPGMAMCRYNQGLDDEFLYGRHYNDIHPAGLDIHAFFDNDTGLQESDNALSGTRLYKQKVGKKDSELTLCDGDNLCDIDYDKDSWWFYPTTDSNCYYTEPLRFDDPTNDNLAIHERSAVSPNIQATRFKRSRLDGIEIDFDEVIYNTNDYGIDSLIDVARLPNSKDFEFNAVLIYYDLYKGTVDDIGYFLEDNTVPFFTPFEILSTNLFGILFLDNVENSSSIDGGYIPRFKKSKPNSTTNLNGNAYGFKLNLKLDTSPINSGVNVETFISTSNTLSMDIYAEALNEMKNTVIQIQNMAYDNALLNSRLNTLEKYILNDKYISLTELQVKLKSIEDTLINEKNIELATQRTDILNSIKTNYDLLQDIINGKVPSKLAIDIDLLKTGDGINLDKSDGKSIKISTTSKNFNLADKCIYSVKNDFIVNEKDYSCQIKLRTGVNYLRLEEPILWLPNKNISLYIIDDNVRWTKGQTFRIYPKQEYLMKNQYGSFNFYIYTGKNLPAWKGISTITSFEFSQHNNRPIIEIICVDDVKMDFIIDYLN